jgi:hypothetical protein
VLHVTYHPSLGAQLPYVELDGWMDKHLFVFQLLVEARDGGRPSQSGSTTITVNVPRGVGGTTGIGIGTSRQPMDNGVTPLPQQIQFSMRQFTYVSY